MEIHNCEKGCCTLKIKPYRNSIPNFTSYNKKRKKAGAFIYDPDTDKVLLVQSRGNLWGMPKGTMDNGETIKNCAIREVKEETGLKISDVEFKKSINIYNKAIYYYIERPFCDVDVQDSIPNNDANGVGWIKTDCLSNSIKNGNITLNRHCKLIFEKLKNRKFEPPFPSFTIVRHKNH